MPTIPYFVDKRRVKGTTTIIGENEGRKTTGIAIWANRWGLEGYEYHNIPSAADTGTLAHELCIDYVQKRKTKIDTDRFTDENITHAKQCLESFKQLLKNLKIRISFAEQPMVHKELFYGGTPDIIGEINKEYHLIDLKTGDIYPHMLIQLAAYDMLLKHEHPDKPIKGFHLIKIGKHDASFQHYFWKELPIAAYSIFHKYLEISNGLWKELEKVL